MNRKVRPVADFRTRAQRWLALTLAEFTALKAAAGLTAAMLELERASTEKSATNVLRMAEVA